MTTRHEEQWILLEQLRAGSDPAFHEHAGRLQELYHAREMAAISHDVYDSARETGEPPHGWLRASENIELLREAMSGSGLTDEELRDLMKPHESGFRAEIYIPGSTILGTGYKPTLVFKGSTGEVIGADGKPRNTAAEDFLGNNFPQSIGLKTDYYDRAMHLAVLLQRNGLDFDIAGHSLGGGKASAASAVTGVHAVTFNSAGLHPETARRFSLENGGIQLYDTNNVVTAWQVQGELLNDGIQGDLANLGVLERERMARLLSDAASVVRNVPEARQVLEQNLLAGIPEASHPAIHAFMDRLAQGNASQLIRDLPQAAGVRRPPLVAMTGDGRELVRREDAASLGELHRLAGPLLAVVSAGARGADMGRSTGEVVAGGGRLADRGLDVAGDAVAGSLSRTGDFAGQGYRLAGVAVNHGTQAMGEAAAQWREAKAGAEAFAGRTRGWLQAHGDQAAAAGTRVLGSIVGVVSGRGQRGLEARADTLEAAGAQARERGHAAAASALERGLASASAIRMAADGIGSAMEDAAARTDKRSRDALVFVGERLDAGFDVTGNRIAVTTARAPAAGATLGGTTGTLVGAAAVYRPGDPFTALDVRGTVRLVQQAKGSLHESVERHGMKAAVIPSLDSEIARREQAARDLLQHAGVRQGDARGREAAASSSAPADRPSWHAGEAGQAFDRFWAAVRTGHPAAISEASNRLMETPAAQAWLEGGRARLEALPGRVLMAEGAGAAEAVRAQSMDAVLVR